MRVEDLLFLARTDSASLPLEFETIDVAPFLAELAGRSEVLARELGAELERKLEGGGLVEIDRQRVEQAVLILVDNAAKYGPPGGTVTFASSVRSGELRISVEDRGSGIPKKHLPRVFERFYRLDKERSRKLRVPGSACPSPKPSSRRTAGVSRPQAVWEREPRSRCACLCSRSLSRQGIKPSRQAYRKTIGHSVTYGSPRRGEPALSISQ